MGYLILLLLLSSTIISSAHAASSSCSGARKDAIKNIRFRVQYSPSTMDSNPISGWTGGGGSRFKITSSPSENNTFSGREFGSGERGQIFGTREYGSGYPYGADTSGPASSIAGRPFPFSMWPISWGPNYLGGGEFYGEDLDMIRPGGVLGVVKVSTTDTSKWPGVSENEAYEMIGDKESLAFMMADLVDWCHATPQWPRRFNPTAVNTTTKMPRPENVIQYYRASSFALAFDGYNNTVGAPSGGSTASSYSFANTGPLPTTIATSAFLKCVNETIGTALPIMANYSGDDGLSSGAIAGIIIGGLVFIVIVWVVWTTVRDWYHEQFRMGTRRRGHNAKRLPNDDPDAA